MNLDDQVIANHHQYYDATGVKGILANRLIKPIHKSVLVVCYFVRGQVVWKDFLIQARI